MPKTKTNLPTVANFDATLKARGFYPALGINAHYFVPLSWEAKEKSAIENMCGCVPGTLKHPISRATAMQCLCLYIENFAR